MFEKKITDEEIRQRNKELKRGKKRKLKEERRADYSKAKTLKVVIVPMILAAIVVCMIYIVMKYQGEIRSIETSMVVSKGEIPANTYIKADEVDQYFDVIEVDATKIPKNIFKSYKDLPTKGFYVEHTLTSKQPVFTDDIAQKDEVMEKYAEGMTLTSIAVDNLSNSVSGRIRKGNIVDVYAIDPFSNMLTLIVENVYVEAAYDNSGESVSDNGIAMVFTIRVAQDEKEAVNQAISDGGIQLYLTQE